MKTLFIAFVLAVISAMAFSTANSGDATYKLFYNDSVLSNNGFLVTVNAVSWGVTPQQQVVVHNFTYTVTRSGAFVANVTLASGGSYKVVADNGTRNVTIAVTTIGYTGSGYLADPYAYTSITSASAAAAPAPGTNVNINSITITPDYFYAVINWTTNASANGTARVYLQGGALNKTLSAPGFAAKQSQTASGLKSYTNYTVIITACTNASCVNASKNFTTLAIVPVISNVTVIGVSDTTADIYWVTDVQTDEKVYFRPTGDSTWQEIPPKDAPWKEIKNYLAFDPGSPYIIGPGPVENGWDTKIKESMGGGGAIYQAPKEKAVMLAASGGSTPYVTPSVPSPGISGMVFTSKSGGTFSINSGMFAAIGDPAILALLARYEHQVTLRDLEDNRLYEFKVSSCADKCVNSSAYTFKTNRTMVPPRIIVNGGTTVEHGTSVIFTIDVLSDNPGGKVAGASISWTDAGGTKSMPLKFGGNASSFVPGSMPYRAAASITFVNSGTHTITVNGVDTYGKNGTKIVFVTVKPKVACKGTNTIYYPSGTSCTNKWPVDGQAGITYNTGIGKCHAFEVCDDSMDYMLADAESCCNGVGAYSANPPKNHGYAYDKAATCKDAIKNTKNAGAMTSLGTESSMLVCKASYLVYGIGPEAVYMKDYYTGEWCCGDSSTLCPKDPHFTAAPWPDSNIQFSALACTYKVSGGTKKAISGWYLSDTDPTLNNNAVVDLPAHSSVNIMNSGSCVDYSFVVTTVLRKAGFGGGDIMSINAPGHLYNLVHLPGDSKYSFIDTTGNGGDFFTGPGWTWTSGGMGQSHCTYKADKCSNDAGMFACPAKSQVSGC